MLTTTNANNQISVYELYNAMRDKQHRQTASFAAVLDRCYGRIRKHANANRLDCLYEVPEFVVGLPLYDINKCINYVMRHLQINGFAVTYFFPRYLHIGWDVSAQQQARDCPGRLAQQHTCTLAQQSKPRSGRTVDAGDALLPPTSSTGSLPLLDAEVQMRAMQEQRSAPILPSRQRGVFRPITEFKASPKFMLQ
jgi:hypothetical protein